MLKELVVFDHLAEFIEIYKEVLLAVDLTGTRLPRRCGNGKTYVVSSLHGLENDRALPCSGRSGYNYKLSSLFSHLLHLPHSCLTFAPPEPPA